LEKIPHAEVNCNGAMGAVADISGAAVRGMVTSIVLHTSGAIVCWDNRVATKCLGVIKRRYSSSQLIKGVNEVQLTGPVAEAAMGRLDAINAIACYAPMAADERGSCKSMSLTNGEVTISTAPVATFSSASESVEGMDMTQMSASRALVCYAIQQTRKGMCRLLVYLNQQTALQIPGDGAVTFSDNYPMDPAVVGFSETKAVVCWGDLNAQKAFCRVIALAGTALSVPTEASVIVGKKLENRAAFAYVSLGNFDAKTGVMCYNAGGAMQYCKFLELDDGANTVGCTDAADVNAGGGEAGGGGGAAGGGRRGGGGGDAAPAGGDDAGATGGGGDDAGADAENGEAEKTAAVSKCDVINIMSGGGSYMIQGDMSAGNVAAVCWSQGAGVMCTYINRGDNNLIKSNYVFAASTNGAGHYVQVRYFFTTPTQDLSLTNPNLNIQVRYFDQDNLLECHKEGMNYHGKALLSICLVTTPRSLF